MTSHFMASVFAGLRGSRYSRLATFSVFISVALVLSSSEIANKATHPHLKDGRNGDSNISRIDGGETFEFWLQRLPTILNVDSRFTDLFKLFIMRYRRLYLFSSEMVNRARIFVSNTLTAERLEQQNQHGRFGITAYSDLTLEEFVQNAGISPPTRALATQLDAKKPPLLDVPSFKLSNVTTPIRQQGSWASSVAHAVTAAVETAIAIKQDKLMQLSVQELMDCASPKTLIDALTFVSQHGLVEDFEHPYLARSSNCSEVPGYLTRYGRNIKVTRVGNSETDLMKAVQRRGAVVALLPVCAELWQHYQGGIISAECTPANSQGSFAVQITGWGTDYGNKYWYLRTSLGGQFGEKGYMRLLLGRSLWGIATEAYYIDF